ncbi:MAG: Na/Pi cotransporter family protein [Verrucomicrobia bacterium]|nr:Na/Pi cotransporter family protein [Verrucomicrobiota bacterium]MDA1005145.1 Na/Pi cotransporter family protein [Verrucomicrobiota bacterium]
MTTFLQILGSLGIFLFGMKVMSEGVQKLAGARMRRALASVTKNRVSGVLTGLFTTGLVQSSSATTVLVVSLVNAGLLTLTESIGVVMGANLGTTLTAWIVATIGKFSLAKIAIPIIGIGFPIFFIAKNNGKALGEFLIGFGLLFLGLDFLKDSVPDLKTLVVEDPATAAHIQSWIEFFSGKGYFSYVLFLIGGIILTLMVQSSSAAMAITITCAINGWFGDDPFEVFRISAAVVLGENIGTTITAWLAALGANRNAKRAARAHLLFNVIGVIWMLVFFLGFTSLVWQITQHLPDSLRTVKGDFQKSEVAFATAIFHTSFNFINILLLIWFVPQIAKIVQRWIPDKGTESARPRLRYISQNLVDLGELNIVEAENAIRLMSHNCDKMFKGFVDVFQHPKEDLSASVSALKKMEEEADEMMHDITEYLVQCSTREIGPTHATNIARMIRIVAELEECTDRIYRLVKLVQRKYNKNREFSEEQINGVLEMTTVVGQSLSVADNFLLRPVPSDVIGSVHTLEERSDKLRKSYNKEAMRRMAGGDIQVEMLYTDINNHLEAIANHALNIIQESSGIAQSRG